MNSALQRTFLALSAICLATIARAQAPNPDSSAAAFASIAENEVLQFSEGITFATWTNTRGKREQWRSKKPEADPLSPRQECLTLEKTDTLPARATLKRTLYFYPPEPRSPYVFPTASSNQLLGICILGMLRIDAEMPNVDSGAVFDRSVREKLASLYGESVGDADVPFWGRGGYDDAARWIHGAEIVSGHDPNPQGYYITTGTQIVRISTAYVYARLPFEKSRFETFSGEDYRDGPIQPGPQFHRAVTLTGLNADLSDRFTKFYEQAVQAAAKPLPPEGKQGEESLFSLLREWINAIKPMPPARRAAGFLAADRLLAASDRRITTQPEKSEQRAQLQELGAVFQANYIANDFAYTRNWEQQARELDPDGPVGEMATLGFMARGSCEENGWSSELFRKIILDGEGLLAKRPDAGTAAQVHFMVGDAYSDIVAIAGGLVGANGEFSATPAEGDIDRGKALGHYRAGLAVDKTSDSAKHAWNQAWRLTAGLLPGQRYTCGGD